MKWPWVSRATYDRLEAELAREREESSRRIDALMAAAVKAMDEAKAEKHLLMVDNARRIDEARAEREALLDRIVQLSGQPALYKVPATATATATQVEQPQPTSNLPPPRAVVTFSDIHAAARAAMQESNFRPDRGVIH